MGQTIHHSYVNVPFDMFHMEWVKGMLTWLEMRSRNGFVIVTWPATNHNILSSMNYSDLCSDKIFIMKRPLYISGSWLQLPSCMFCIRSKAVTRLAVWQFSISCARSIWTTHQYFLCKYIYMWFVCVCQQYIICALLSPYMFERQIWCVYFLLWFYFYFTQVILLMSYIMN